MENIFNQFSGADLDRLIKCIQAVRGEGLTITPDCHAGINPNSGNVYIWSEEWAGCVYCSVGFDVAWCYSCPYCGEEYIFATEAECRAYSEKYCGNCQSCNHCE